MRTCFCPEKSFFSSNYRVLIKCSIYVGNQKCLISEIGKSFIVYNRKSGFREQGLDTFTLNYIP